MPLVVNAAATMHGLELATGSVIVALIIAAAITRVMALPVVEAFSQRFVLWLAVGACSDESSASTIEVDGPVTLDE